MSQLQIDDIVEVIPPDELSDRRHRMSQLELYSLHRLDTGIIDGIELEDGVVFVNVVWPRSADIDCGWCDWRFRRVEQPTLEFEEADFVSMLGW